MHISRMSDRFIKHPLEVVSVGDIVEVTVLEVDEKKGRISLSMVDGVNRERAPQKGSGAKDRERPAGKRGGSPKKEEYAPGTIGYILSHGKR